MNKNDLKKLVVCGFALGCLSVQSVSADEKTQEEVLATTEKTAENLFAAACGGGKCGGRSAPKNNRAMTPEEEQQIQGQGQGHSCAGKAQQDQGQGQGHSCAGRSQPRPYQA